jgi:hypothetical protein
MEESASGLLPGKALLLPEGANNQPAMSSELESCADLSRAGSPRPEDLADAIVCLAERGRLL